MTTHERERILCGCLCDEPIETWRARLWRFRWTAIICGLIGIIAGFMSGCSAEAKPPQVALEVDGITVKRTDSMAACEQLRNDIIVALTLPGIPVPKMRCN